jgi:DNA-binding NtrC family response regulator
VADLASGPLAAVRRFERLEQENERLQEAVLGGGLIGESPAMRRVAERIARIAPTESTVLLRGESGTGKEVTARALHRASPRRRGPFVAVNCAALVETLLESELFGHERGAFTGATTTKQGRLETADGGTLFLDEVGEMPAGQQAKLLRVLEDRTFSRVGGNRSIRLDVRIVAATNRDLEAAVAQGSFRRDLYYRLAVITLALPPLRERGRDVLLLARHFADRTAADVGRRVAGFSDAARARLMSYDWPGNVRELANAVEHAVVLGRDEVIRLDDLPESVLEEPPRGETAETAEADPAPATYHQALNRLKRHLILEAVEAAGGNVTRAAERLDLHPNHLHRLITNLGLREEPG